MKKLVFLGFILVLLGSFSVQFITPSIAKAASGPCFFPAGAGGLVKSGGTCKESGSGDYGINDVLSGRNSKGKGFAIETCVTTKAEFINWIRSRWYYTNNNCDNDLGDAVRDKIGAAFLVQEMRGQTGVWPTNADIEDWAARMRLADIGFARGSVTVGDTSYYDNDERNVFYGNHANVVRNVITITASGATIAEVETECGNLVAGSRNLPETTLSANAGADATINAGQLFNFTSSVTATNRYNVGDTTFRYRVYSSGPNALPAAAAVANTNVAIAGTNPRAEAPYSVRLNVPGRYCRTIEINRKPSYARYNPQTNQQCVTVVRAGTFRVTATATDFEKGSTSANVTYTLFADTTPCGSGNQVVTWGGTGIPNRSVTIIDCSPAGQKDQVVLTVPGNPTLNNAPVGPYGSYVATVTAPAGVPNSPPAVINVYEVPYFRAYGNDISAAGCEDVPDAALSGSIIGSTKSGIVPLVTGGAGNKYAGAAAEYAAIALNGKPNTVLTGVFQNYAGSAPIRLQAFWGSNAVCPDTIYGKVIGTNLPGIVNRDVTTGDYTLTNVGAGNNWYVRANGNTEITGVANASGKQTIFVNGDARIASNIITPVSGSFDNKTAPVILIIASGDIYIDPSVSQVDAILVAKSDIYTCSRNGGYGQHAQGTVHETPALGGCRSKLIINGALNASNVHFQRSIGTRLLAPDNETSNRVPTPPGNTDTAAESVKYPYYLYFTTPYLADKAESTFQSYFTPTPFF